MSEEMRLRCSWLDDGSGYVILEGSESNINKVRRDQQKVEGVALSFRIVIRDRYGIAYREHLIFQPTQTASQEANHG